jgi:hypothetical protein
MYLTSLWLNCQPMKALSVVFGILREGQGDGDGVELLPGVEGVKNEDDIAWVTFTVRG